MALLTKTQVREAVRQAIDDPSDQRWTDANLDILIGMVGDVLWSAILDSFEFATSQSDTVTPAAGGKIDVTVAGALLSQRFYRVQKVTRVSDLKEAQPKVFKEVVPQLSYYMLGKNIVTDPAVTGSNSVTVEYSYLPTNFNSLASDGTSLPSEYPEGHEMALVYLASAAAIIKGDAENMGQIGRMADMAVTAMLTHIARRYPIGAMQRINQVRYAILNNPLVSGG